MPDTAYEALRRDIVSGVLAPGAHLAELVLADRYGVSRTPVREGLRRLEQDGLVERRGRRMYVRLHRPEEILDIFEVHILLEEAAARDAALRRTPLDLSLLGSALEDMRALPASATGSTRSGVDRVFHQRLWAAAHSDTLTEVLDRLNVQLHRYPRTTLDYPGRWVRALAEHEELLAAVGEHRAEDAAALARAHLTGAREVRLRMFAEADPVAPAATH